MWGVICARTAAAFQWIGSALMAGGRITGLCITAIAIVVLLLIFGPNFRGALYDLMPIYDGQIIVNSPSVYTRQRLVNDRLEQSAWLKDQLNVTTSKSKVPFHSVDQFRNEVSSKMLEMGASTNQRSASASAETQGSTAQNNNTNPSAATEQQVGRKSTSSTETMEPTTADLFRAMNTFREEIRSEIMETQLDDRHDIEGNTIYRLSFDTTVLPGTRTDALAVVKVDLQHGEDKLDGEYYQLYLAWLRQMQGEVTGSIEAISQQLLLRSQLDPRLGFELPNFILRATCQFITSKSGNNYDYTYRDTADDKERQIDTCNPEIFQSTARISAAAWKEIESLARARIKAAQDMIAEFTILYLKYRKEIQEAIAWSNIRTAVINANLNLDNFQYAKGSYLAKRCTQNNRPDFRVPLRDFDSGGEALIECPPSDPPLEGLIAAAILYTNLVQQDPSEQDLAPFAQRLVQQYRNDCTETDKAKCALPDPDPGNLRCLAAEYMWGTLNRFDPVERSLVPRFDHFFNVQLVGSKIGNCTLLFGPKPREPVAVEKDPVKRLMESLNAAIEVYAYSITPKNLAQRISTSSTTRDALQALLSARKLVSEQELSLVAKRLDDTSNENRAIKAHPIVVGFGFAANEGKRINQSPPLKTDDPPLTEFGWIVAPQFQVGENRTRAQIDYQYALAAVISVPSWWKSVRLTIHTCWVSRRDVRGDERAEMCTTKNTIATREHIVRLPGVIPELTRKLGFDVLQEPRLYVDKPGDQVESIEIGRPAAILLRGRRLWRSTEVTLGGQKADEIVVLPNMEGIIAKFRCVHEQTAGLPRVPIRVWTSEGVTEPVSMVLQWKALAPGGKAADRDAESMSGTTEASGPSPKTEGPPAIVKPSSYQLCADERDPASTATTSKDDNKKEEKK